MILLLTPLTWLHAIFISDSLFRKYLLNIFRLLIFSEFPLVHLVILYFQTLVYVLPNRKYLTPILTKSNTTHPSSINLNLNFRHSLSVNMDVYLTLSRLVSLPCRGSSIKWHGSMRPRRTSEHCFISFRLKLDLELKLNRTNELCI